MDLLPVLVEIERRFAFLIGVLVEIVVLNHILTNINSETFGFILISDNIDEIL